jgi:hypothetical protein
MSCWSGAITEGYRYAFIGRLFLLGRPNRQNLPRPYTFNSVEEYKAGLKRVGEALRTAPQIGSPIIIGITG